MSFILDALKKIERDKRRGEHAQGIEAFAASRRSYGGRRSVLAMGSIAIASAAVTAAGVTFWLQRDDSGGASVVEPETSSAAAERGVASPEPEVREPVAAAVPEPEPAPEAVGETPAPEPPIEAGPDEVASESAPPVRLVGRERALLDAVSVNRAAGSEDARVDEVDAGVEPSGAPLPENFPKLVLQGTSVIGTDAVAVISDQRVFEGDLIEGALVVRIGEREVELEFDGRRFTLTL